MSYHDICPECMKVRAHTRSMPPYKCPRCKRLADLRVAAQAILGSIARNQKWDPESAGFWDGEDTVVEALRTAISNAKEE